jgi:hypothetical protein
MSIYFCAKTADCEEADDLLRRVAEAARNVLGERLFPDPEPTLRDPDDVEEAPGRLRRHLTAVTTAVNASTTK